LHPFIETELDDVTNRRADSISWNFSCFVFKAIRTSSLICHSPTGNAYREVFLLIPKLLISD